MSEKPETSAVVPAAEPAAEVAASEQPRRVAGQAWAVAGFGILGGFFVGAVAGGGIGFEIDQISTIIEIVTAVPAAVSVTIFFARKMGRRVRLSAIIRWGLAVIAWSGGFLLGFAGGVPETARGWNNISGWLGSWMALYGFALVFCTLLTATLLSVRRFAPAENAEPDPTLEDLLHLR